MGSPNMEEGSEDEVARLRAENERLRAAGNPLEFMLSFYVKHFSPLGAGHTVRQEALDALAAWQEASRG